MTHNPLSSHIYSN